MSRHQFHYPVRLSTHHGTGPTSFYGPHIRLGPFTIHHQGTNSRVSVSTLLDRHFRTPLPPRLHLNESHTPGRRFRTQLGLRLDYGARGRDPRPLLYVSSTFCRYEQRYYYHSR